MTRGLFAAAAISGSEAVARRLISSRARALLVAYLAVAAFSTAAGARLRPGRSTPLSLLGAATAAAGYPLGRMLLADRPPDPPPDPLGWDLAALGVVAFAEELSWGALVEAHLGAMPTAALFAAKHPFIDGRTRRVLGLFLFWLGLAAVRRSSPRAALLAHVLLNEAGVALGHWDGRDRF